MFCLCGTAQGFNPPPASLWLYSLSLKSSPRHHIHCHLASPPGLSAPLRQDSVLPRPHELAPKHSSTRGRPAC